MGIYITVAHYWACIGLWRVFQVQAATLLWVFILWPISGLGITAGAHRLWSHRSFNAGPIYRCAFMLANSIANQGPIHYWVRSRTK
jgi:stearoyl-CoA desaturase (delta-9 desaturase)